MIAKLLIAIILLFIAPALASQLVWQLEEGHASSWSTANWSSAGILPEASENSEAAIYVMSARTGRWKGGFSVHSWLVTKEKNASAYNRYDKVGWGRPLRKNSYDADANWYSNAPEIIWQLDGETAEALIPKIEAAISDYPYSTRGDYRIWPGPNSNTFIAYVLNRVPEIGAALPPNAVGRDFLGEARLFQIDPDGMNLQFNLAGIVGFAIGKRHGLELHFLGLVTGIDFVNPAIKLPGFGRIAIS